MAGTIIHRGNNSYRLQYMHEGIRYSKTIKATSDSIANKELALFVAEIEKGSYNKNSNYLFVELAQLYLDKYAKPNLSETTYKNYICQLNKYILNEIGQMKINKIKRLHIQEFANKLVLEYNLSSKTVSNYITTISSILVKAVEWDLLNTNVADKITIPKNNEKRKKKVILYSYDELNMFLEALKSLKNRELQMAIYTSLHTGARRGEVLALTFNDINFERNSIDFNKSKICSTSGTKLKDIKTGKNRQFYVPQNYINLVKDYYMFLGEPDKNTSLFKIHPDTYSDYFKKFLIENNLRKINLKDLRSLNESILVNKGIDVVNASKRLGHLPSTATNYYLDQIPEEDKKASAVLQNLL